MSGLILMNDRESRAHAQVVGGASKYTPTHWVNYIVCNLHPEQE